MFGRRFRKQSVKENDNPYWISFSDAISGLLIVFILATAYLIRNYEKNRADNVNVQDLRLEINELKKENKNCQDDIKIVLAEKAIIENKFEKEKDKRENILNFIKDKEYELVRRLSIDLKNMKETLQSKGILVLIDDNIMRIPSYEINFPNNQASIPDSMISKVDQIGKIVIDYAKRARDLEAVFIEGHTDCNPTNRDKRGNMGLSVDRAISISSEWAKLDKDFWDIKNNLGKPLFSVSGYGELRPIPNTMLGKCENETSENLEKNRRIDIRFVTRHPTFTDLEYINND